MSVTGRLHSLESFGAVDGPGIRYVIFLQGCPLKCIYCHNPDTWSPCDGREVTVDELVQKALPYRNFLRGGGITITGGEPLLQSDFVYELIRAFHAENLHVAIDTAGSIPLEHCKHAVDEADMLLLDIKALDPKLCRMMCGSDGQHAKELLAYCEEQHKPVWIRHVMVPDYTLDYDRLYDLAQYLKKFTCVERIELLPFHQMGSYKWEAANMHYALRDKRTPDKAEVEKAHQIFKDMGLRVQ